MGHMKLKPTKLALPRDFTAGFTLKRVAAPIVVPDAVECPECPECPEPEPCPTGCSLLFTNWYVNGVLMSTVDQTMDSGLNGADGSFDLQVAAYVDPVELVYRNGNCGVPIDFNGTSFDSVESFGNNNGDFLVTPNGDNSLWTVTITNQPWIDRYLILSPQLDFSVIGADWTPPLDLPQYYQNPSIGWPQVAFGPALRIEILAPL
jgi:hypothetical protein